MARAATPSRRSRPANAQRGEHMLELDGVSYLLRPSHAAIEAIEVGTERSLLDLVRLANVGGLRTGELGVVAAELIRAGAAPDDQATRHVGAERIAELIFEAGVHRVMAKLTLVLLDAASGGRDAAGNVKAAPVITGAKS